MEVLEPAIPSPSYVSQIILQFKQFKQLSVSLMCHFEA